MHELACPSCNAPSQYDLKDYLQMCPFCSVTFKVDMESGRKEVYSDHYIIPNSLDSRQIKTLVTEWIRRLHHNPAVVDKEYFVIDINGFSIPYWIISLEVHTMWKGLVRRFKATQDHGHGSNFLMESGQFRRNFRWGISARANLCENWGMSQLHEPKEHLVVDWDGFPLDSTFSRGRIDPKLGVKRSSKKDDELSAYDAREFFEFKFGNGLPILAIQVSEEEALRRAKAHVEQYHLKLSRLNVDIHIDTKTELEIAGIQLIHLPFWYARYVYRPISLLKHFHKTKEKSVIIEGYAGGILKGEMPIIQQDKMWINAIVATIATFFFFFLGGVWHTAFFLIGVFCIAIAAASAYKASSAVKGEVRRRITTTVTGNDEKSEQAA